MQPRHCTNMQSTAHKQHVLNVFYFQFHLPMPSPCLLCVWSPLGSLVFFLWPNLHVFLWTVFSRSLDTVLVRTIHGHLNAGWTDLWNMVGSCSCHCTLSPARLGCLGPELLSLAHPMALAVVFQLWDFCRTCLSAKVLNFLSCEMLLCCVKLGKESSYTTG